MARTIPRADMAFNNKQKIITEIVEEHLLHWNIDTDWYNSRLKPAQQEWAIAWKAHQNRPTRTIVDTARKNTARKDYESLLRKLVNCIKSSLAVTTVDLASMGIVPDPSGRAVKNPVPATHPVCIVDSSMIRRLIFHFRNQGSMMRGKPHGVHGVELCWSISDIQPHSAAELTHSDFETSSPLILDFEESERGKLIWCCLRWENTRGKQGPWGEMFSAIIP